MDKDLKKFNDLAMGCIMGAYSADACGSYNEFNRKIAN